MIYGTQRDHHPPSLIALSLASDDGVTDKRGQTVAGKFVIKKGPTGKFRFNLLARNGQVVATSEAYGSKAAAMGGIRSVQKLVADASVEDQTTKEWAASEAARKAATKAKKSSATAPGKATKKSSSPKVR